MTFERVISATCSSVALVLALTACGETSTSGVRHVDAGGPAPRRDGGVSGSVDSGGGGGGGSDAGRAAAGVDAGPAAGGVDAGPPPARAGACTNAADEGVAASMDVAGTVGDCASASFGGEPATMNCIVERTGLSMACAACYDAVIQCSIMNCLTDCLGGDSPGCTTCRVAHCDPAFTACSGLTP